jgi:hypothetical protein
VAHTIPLAFGISSTSNELKMDLEKVRDIKECPSPRSVFEVTIFHGLVSFYRKFIKNFSNIGAPIVDTIRKKHGSLDWTKEVEKGFRFLKEKITEQPILIFLYFRKTFQVKCHPSGVAIGAVLSQDDKLVAYFSEKLNDAKRKYLTYDKEFYSTIQALKKWSH